MCTIETKGSPRIHNDSRELQKQIEEGLEEVEEARAPYAEDLEASLKILREGLQKFRELLSQANDDFSGIILGDEVCGDADRIIDAIRCSPETSPTAVFGRELRTLESSDESINEQTYLGATCVAAWGCYNGEAVGWIFGNPVNFSDYQEFLQEVKEITGEDLGATPSKTIPESLVEQAKALEEQTLRDSLKAYSSILDNVTGELVGAFSREYRGQLGWWSKLDLIGDGGIDQPAVKEKIFGKLLEGASPVFDASLNEWRYQDAGEYTERLFLGGRCIATYHRDFSTKHDSRTIMEHPVSEQSFDTFVKAAGDVLKEKGLEPGGKLQGELEKEFLRFKMEKTLSDAREVSPGWRELNHIYGSPYFGSGGGYGSVKAYDLAAWEQGRRVRLELATKDGDNGFVSGPKSVDIKPGMIVVARGGDDIGENGRDWQEIYVCRQQQNSVVDL